MNFPTSFINIYSLPNGLYQAEIYGKGRRMRVYVSIRGAAKVFHAGKEYKGNLNAWMIEHCVRIPVSADFVQELIGHLKTSPNAL